MGEAKRHALTEQEQEAFISLYLYQQLRLPYSKRYKFAYLVMQDSGYQLFAESVENELRVSLQKKDYDITKEQEILNLLGLTTKRNGILSDFLAEKSSVWRLQPVYKKAHQ